MRNFLKLALLCCATTMFASTSKTVDKIDKQTTSIVDKTSDGLSQVYGDGTNAISTVYGDIKSLAPKVEATVKQLAKGLKVGAESVWKILVKQQKVWSWCYLIGCILATFSWIHFYYRFNKGNSDKTEYNTWKDSNIAITIITGVIAISLSILSIMHFESMMTGFINPEFGAMRNIITIASQLK